MEEMEVTQKIARLRELTDNPEKNVAAVLRTFHDLFKLTHEGHDLSPESAEWLNKTACLFLSSELHSVLLKHRLEVYGFHFAALNFIDVDDVVDDLSNEEVLKNSFPPGAYNKLKRDLLSKPSVEHTQPKMEITSSSTELMETKNIRKEEVVVKKPEDNPLSNPLYNSLLKNFMAWNKEGVMESLRDFVNDEHFSIKSIEVKNLLKQSAKFLLSVDVAELLEKNLLGEYSYLLAVNHVLELDDLKEDITNGDILKRALPQGAFNKLERQLKTPLPTAPSAVNVLEGGLQNLSLSSENSDNKTISLPCNIENKPPRLAEKLLPLCRKIGKNPSGMELYQLPLTREAKRRTSKTERFILGERSSTKAESKTILLMGATGSGKTTLINAMVNYILDVEFEDPFRFMLISEEGTSSKPKNQAHSQTSKVTAYELHYQDGFKIPYSLVIVDTPGYGDTKGVERDYEITDFIQQFFKDDNGIQVLDAVGFTVQAALARLTPTQKYIFESILAIFGNDVRDNIRFLVTFTDGQTPPVLEAIKEANITHQLDGNGQPRHHRFNNSGFFTSKQMDGDADFSSMFWKLGMKNFDSFFSGLSIMKTRSLTLTKEVLEERKCINVTIEGLSQKIRNQLTKMEELRKTKQVIENHSDQINANKNFKYDVTVSKGNKIEINDDKFTTNCSKCSITCHFPCAYSDDADKQNCSAMNKEGNCTVCKLNCKWDLHTNQKYYWEFKDVTETKTYEDIKKKYEDHVNQKLSKEGVLQALEAEVEQIKFDLNQDIEKITACLQRLDEIALRPDAFTTTDYIDLMIESEKKEKKAGFQERIKSLKALLDNTRVMKDIRAGTFTVPGAAVAAASQSCSQSYVTITTKPVEKKGVEKKGYMGRAVQYVFGKNDPGI